MIIETIKPIKHDIQLSFGASDIKRTVIKQNSNHTHILRITLYDTENKLLIDEGWMSEGWKIEISVKKPDNTFIVNADNIAIVDNTIPEHSSASFLFINRMAPVIFLTRSYST